MRQGLFPKMRCAYFCCSRQCPQEIQNLLACPGFNMNRGKQKMMFDLNMPMYIGIKAEKLRIFT